MSKEYLEALEILKNMLIGNGCNDNINDYVDNLILPIEQALQRLEQIDNTKPSEALELVWCLKDYFLNMIPYQDWLNIIEKYILKAQEQEKVLEIIKEKEVDVHLLKACISCYTDSLNAYNSEIKKLHSNHEDYQNKPLSFYLLTQEEFELVKRYFK